MFGVDNDELLQKYEKEEKQKLFVEFMNSMTEEERSEMMQMIMPLMLKEMEPGAMMANMMKDFDEDRCKEMMKDLTPKMLDKCKQMMAYCLKASEEH